MVWPPAVRNAGCGHPSSRGAPVSPRPVGAAEAATVGHCYASPSIKSRAAASLTRDRIIENLKEEVGDFGSGYPADPKPIAFLRKWLSERSSPPPYVRTHWKTYTRLVRERTTRKLDEFF